MTSLTSSILDRTSREAMLQQRACLTQHLLQRFPRDHQLNHLIWIATFGRSSLSEVQQTALLHSRNGGIRLGLGCRRLLQSAEHGFISLEKVRGKSRPASLIGIVCPKGSGVLLGSASLQLKGHCLIGGPSSLCPVLHLLPLFAGLPLQSRPRTIAQCGGSRHCAWPLFGSRAQCPRGQVPSLPVVLPLQQLQIVPWRWIAVVLPNRAQTAGMHISPVPACRPESASPLHWQSWGLLKLVLQVEVPNCKDCPKNSLHIEMASWPVGQPHQWWESLGFQAAGGLMQLHSSSWTVDSWLWPMVVPRCQLPDCTLRWAEDRNQPLNLAAAVPCNWSQLRGYWGTAHAMRELHLWLMRFCRCLALHWGRGNSPDLAVLALRSNSSGSHREHRIPSPYPLKDKNPRLRRPDLTALLLVLPSSGTSTDRWARWARWPWLSDISLASQALHLIAFASHDDVALEFHMPWHKWLGRTGRLRYWPAVPWATGGIPLPSETQFMEQSCAIKSINDNFALLIRWQWRWATCPKIRYGWMCIV